MTSVRQRTVNIKQQVSKNESKSMKRTFHNKIQISDKNYLELQ